MLAHWTVTLARSAGYIMEEGCQAVNDMSVFFLWAMCPVANATQEGRPQASVEACVRVEGAGTPHLSLFFFFVDLLSVTPNRERHAPVFKRRSLVVC